MSTGAAVVPEVAADARGSARARLWAWIDDRLNPILVKEVRQALRGRYFRNLFWFTVVAATGISVLRILDAESGGHVGSLGPSFFLANFGVLAIATLVFVPLWAFQSMSSEWDENTYDLLVISNLRPRQLLLGKALAAGVQSVLFFSTFAPYLVSTFLMGGVDLLSIVLVFAGTLVMSIALSLVALGAATFGRSRLVRALLALLVVGVLLWLVSMTIVVGVMIIESPGFLLSTDFSVVIWVFLSVVPLVAALALAAGCARLAHEQENRSTFLRVIITVTSLVALAWGVYASLHASGFFDSEWLMFLPMAALMISIIPFLFFVTEAEPLGRRVTKQVPRSRLRALLALPFLPGGARGLWLYIAVAGVTLAVIGIVATLKAAGGTPGRSGAILRHGSPQEAMVFVSVMFAYGFVAIGLVSGLASFGIRSLRGRTGVRIAIPLCVVAAVVLPALTGFLFDDNAWARFEHPLNPFWVLLTIAEDHPGRVAGGMSLLAFAVVLTLAVNAHRLWSSIGETLEASAARRERERDLAAQERGDDPVAG